MARLMTIKQFMDRYQISRSTVYRLIASGALLTVKIGRAVRIPTESAEAWAKGLLHAVNDNAR